MARKQIEDIIEELRSWLPNYDARSPNDYPVLLFRILASLPGGDELEDMGYETFQLGWHEADQLARVIDAIQDKRDVEDLVRGLVYGEEEDLGEARAPRSCTVTISDDFATLGPDATKRDLRAYADNLRTHLEERFGGYVQVRTGSVASASSDCEDIEEYVHHLERGDGWIALLDERGGGGMEAPRITQKTAHFLDVIRDNPGITTAELHRRAGRQYAHGSHKFTYDTVNRMLRNGLITRGPVAPGLRGSTGLYVPEARQAVGEALRAPQPVAKAPRRKAPRKKTTTRKKAPKRRRR